MTALDALNATTIVGRPGAVYANEQSLYVAVRHDHWAMPVWYFEDPEQHPEATTVHKFQSVSRKHCDRLPWKRGREGAHPESICDG